MSLDTTYTSATFNSYMSIADVDTEVAALAGIYPVTKWQSLGDTEKEGIIKQATKDLNSFSFVGALNDSILTDMLWPRSNALYANGLEIDETVIPQFVKDYITLRVLEYTNIKFEFTEKTLPTIPTSIRVGSLAKDTGFGGARFRTIADYPSFRAIQFWVEGGGQVNQVIRA